MARKRDNVIIKPFISFLGERFGDILSGVVFWLPIGVIVLVASYFFSNLEDFGDKLLSFFLSEEFLYPGLGIVLWIIIFLLTGLLLKHTRVGDLLSVVPVVGMLFRKKGGRMMTVGRLQGLTPCLFLYSPTCPSYGWILSEENVSVGGEGRDFTLINVYYPNVPSIITGQIYPVRKEAVIKLGNPSKEVIDLLLYAIRSPESIEYLPWEGEDPEDFRKRAEVFGLDIARIQAP
jgi:uncharacterized membrane protein